ncbi:MAG: hypothetical protein ACRDOH_06670 [Streptosporangiaceae bacterium]
MTDLPDVAVGATWRCVDLHLHTPGVRSFELPPGVDVHKAGDRERLADEYVRKLVEAGIQVAAITDYQEVRQPWYSLIRRRANAAGITVLPGAEMSIGQGGGKGLHLLLIAATHNANIPVNGDAELVLSLADEDGQCQVRTRDSIDDTAVREEIRNVLEGGAEAFRRRAQKYGGLDDTR